MRYLSGFIFTALTVFLCWFLDGKRVDALPLAMGKFLDPFNGCWQNAESKDAFADMELKLEGLTAPVSVVYDPRRVPHIFAQNGADLYLAQGYVTARDRLWQMEFQVMAAAGRLSEIISNPRVVQLDREKRRRGMVEAAEKALAVMEKDPELKAIADAYTSGVNHWIEGLSRKNFPLEYKLLDYEPEPWSNLKTSLLMKMMAWNLTGRTRDFENSNILAAAGWERYCEILPASYDSISPIIPKTTPWTFAPESIPPKPTDSLPLQSVGQLEYTQPHPYNGSNNWAVHGTKTASGKPILCNDPHLGLSLPSIWYEIQLSTPHSNVYGASMPGAPLVVIGFNKDIAWGVTNASRDVLDWYKVEFKDESRKEYKYGGKWLKTEEKVHKIKMVNGDILLDTVLWTVHGPVVYDRNFGDSTSTVPSNLAMRWVAHEASEELRTFLLLNQAKNESDYRNAIQYFACPGQNFIFASNGGDIAITQQGRFPNKWEGQGQFVMDGSNPAHSWQSYIPWQHNPYVKNPPRGFVSSANQHPADPSYPYRIDGNYDATRGRRINQVLTDMSKVTAKDMMDLQNDTYNMLAAEVLPGLLREVKRNDLSQEGQKALAELEKWQFFNDTNLIAPVYFELWCDQIQLKKWNEGLVAPGQYVHFPNSYLTLHDICDLAADSSKTEERAMNADLLLASLEAGMADLNNWKQENPGLEATWQNWNNARVIHLSRQKAFSQFRLPVGGNHGIVNAVYGNHGPSWRMIVELGDVPKAYGTYPGGPSGNPGSFWYDNQVPDWAAGKYQDLFFFQQLSEAEKQASSTLKILAK